jgi:hypothetical protein
MWTNKKEFMWALINASFDLLERAYIGLRDIFTEPEAPWQTGVAVRIVLVDKK